MLPMASHKIQQLYLSLMFLIAVFKHPGVNIKILSALAFVALFHCGLPNSQTTWSFSLTICSHSTVKCVSPNLSQWPPPTSSTSFSFGNFIHYFNSFNHHLYIRGNQISNFNPIFSLNFWYQISKCLLDISTSISVNIPN